MVVAGQIGQVGLEELDHIGGRFQLHMVPVGRTQCVLCCEFLLRLDDQQRKAGLAVNIDNPHAEVRRYFVERVQADERLVDRRRVFVAELREIELTKTLVNLVGVTSLAVLREVIIDLLNIAHVRETQTDDAERIGDTMLVIVFLLVRIEVVADSLTIIEHRHEVVERFLVEVLLVKRPALLVARQLVVGRRLTHSDHCTVCVLSVDIFLADEEVLATAEVHFVHVARMRVFTHQAIHDFHGLVRFANLIVRARHLVQDLVVALVVRVGFENFLVGRDRLPRSGRHSLRIIAKNLIPIVV